MAFFSTEPPSWIYFVAQADWWVKALAAYAALFVAELVKKAAADTWENRAKAVDAVIAAGTKLKKLAVESADLRRRVSVRTALAIGIPLADEYRGVRLTLASPDADGLAAEIALFVHHLPAIERLVRQEDLMVKATAGVCLTLLGSGDLEVAWFDSDTLEKQIRILSLWGSDA